MTEYDKKFEVIMIPGAPLLEGRNLIKTFDRGDQKIHVLKDVNFIIEARESVAIVGSSGSGKSTLLHILGTVDKVTSGQVLFKGKNLTHLSDREISIFRRRSLAFIFQAFHLLPHLTALENVQWPLIIDGQKGTEIRDRAMVLLQSVGLEHRALHFPFQLSGGEMQRVAIARALINSPEIILADEPTGNLDSKNGEEVLNLLFERVEQSGCSLIMVTHDLDSARKCHRMIRLRDGVVE